MAQTRPYSISSVARRARSRLKTSLPARAITLSHNLPVTLLDISLTGARIELDGSSRTMAELQSGETVLLQWCSFDAIGTLVWECEQIAGIAFDESITPSVLIATRDQQDSFAAQGGAHNMLRKNARQWVEGQS